MSEPFLCETENWNFKDTTRNFRFLLILAPPVDKSSSDINACIIFASAFVWEASEREVTYLYLVTNNKKMLI